MNIPTEADDEFWNSLPMPVRLAWVADCESEGCDALYARIIAGGESFKRFVAGFRAGCSHDELLIRSDMSSKCNRCGKPDALQQKGT